jgi:SAM-dependent methyltransferase
MLALSDLQDAYGHAMLDFYLGQGGFEIIERDDGVFNLSKGPGMYFSSYADWPAEEQQAIQHAWGRVLDIGCGAGRHALYLQERGCEVLGSDSSPNAIRVCKDRGMQDARLLSITQISSKLGIFDTVLLLGNNFGLVGDARGASWFLKRLNSMTREEAKVILSTRNPFRIDLPEQGRYLERNRARGRMPGQTRIRVRYKEFVTPWFDHLMLSAEELDELLSQTGWHTAYLFPGESGRYAAILKKP